MKISEQEKQRILEMHSIEKEVVSEQLFSKQRAAIKGAAQNVGTYVKNAVTAGKIERKPKLDGIATKAKSLANVTYNRIKKDIELLNGYLTEAKPEGGYEKETEKLKEKLQAFIEASTEYNNLVSEFYNGIMKYHDEVNPPASGGANTQGQTAGTEQGQAQGQGGTQQG